MELLSRKKTLKKSKLLFFIGSSYLALFLLWFFLTYTNIIKPIFLPKPPIILFELIRLFTTGIIFDDIIITLLRLILGFLISLMIAVPLGFLIGLYKKGEAILSPLAVLRYIPYTALIPLSILWFGLGEFQKIFILMIGNIPFLTLLIANGVSRIPFQIIDTAYTLGENNKGVIKKIILPYCAPLIYDSARLMFAVGWLIIIVVEMIGAENGLGHMIIEAQRYLKTPTVISIIIVIGIIGFLADFIFNRMYKIFFPWSEKGGSDA